VDDDSKSVCGGLQIVEEFFAIPVRFLDFLASVAAIDDMVKIAGIFDAKRSGHTVLRE